MRRILLASSSPYRRELLGRLRLPFDVLSPDIDEMAVEKEIPLATALRLARAKAEAIAKHESDAIVIGSDQVADVDGKALSKPGNHEVALHQLLSMQGRAVIFHTALAVFDTRSGQWQADSVPTTVTFRSLPAERLDAYLRTERPYDCAGAAKVESLGIALVSAVCSEDPTALIGLPLIRLTSMLHNCGVDLPA